MLREVRLQNAAKMAEFRPDEVRLHTSLKTMGHEMDDLRKTTKAMKMDNEELRRRLTELTQENKNLEGVLMELRGQIVSSPEKLQSKIEDMQRQLNRDKEMFQDTEAKERQTQSKINALTQYCQVKPSLLPFLRNH